MSLGVRKNRTNILGSEWIYIKIYGHQEVIDKIILDELLKLYEKEWKEKALNFYYVRFSDPDFHIRVRIKIGKTQDLLLITNSFHDNFNPAVQKGYLSKIEYSTYEKEIERYGINTISYVEKIFSIDAFRILTTLKILKDFDTNERYRSLCGLLSIENTLNSFEIDIERRIVILRNLANNYFKTLFSDSKAHLKIINDRYREERNSYLQLYKSKVNDSKISAIKRSMKINQCDYNQMSNKISAITNGEKIEVMVADILHMSMNRLFTSNNNQIEAILYYYAFKNYLTIKKQRINK